MQLHNECDMPYSDYRERILVSDGTIQCCETGIQIPAGFPYALCQGTYDEPDNGHQDWSSHPQCIEAWRFLRNANEKHNLCFNFEGAEVEMDDFWLEGAEGRLFVLSWYAMKKRVKDRYSAGASPRLWPHERNSLESGDFEGRLPFSTRKNK